jgi:nucleoside-diphosphate-sugar epimerase
MVTLLSVIKGSIMPEGRAAPDMNILVIGGSGLLGRKTVLHLVRDNEIARVVAMDVVPPKEWIIKSMGEDAAKYQFLRGDVSQLEDILSAIKLYSIDRLINLAFLLPGAVEANPRRSVKVNELGMCNAFEAARLMGIKRVIYMSSEGVYGPQEEYGDRPVTEDDPVHPQSAYAIAKQLAEMLAARYAELYGLSLTTLRPPVIWGHGGLAPNVIKWFSDIVSLPAIGKSFSVDNDGTGRHSLAPADDCAEFIKILIKAPSSPHAVYNIGGPPTSLREIASVVRRFIPGAVIKLSRQAESIDAAKGGLPWKLSMARAGEDYGFSCMPIDAAVRQHINDARLEARLEPLKR